MALVAYDNSDSSEYENDDNEKSAVVVLNNIENKTSLKLPEPTQKQAPIKFEEPTDDEQKQHTEIKTNQATNDESSLFNFLPKPTSKKQTLVEEDDEFLHKKEESHIVKPKAKITVPSLSDFKDVETSMPVAKPKQSNGKKSGLLSMLPQPRNGVSASKMSLIPNVLTKKPVTQAPKKPLPTPLKKVNSTPLVNEYSDESDTDEVQNDFFSINKPVEIPDIDMPLEMEDNATTKTTTQKPRGIESFFKKEEAANVQLEPDYIPISDQAVPGSSDNDYGADSSNSNEAVLDDEAIMKLCGTRGKRKREDIQIVDVNQQDVLAGAREMLLKGLMDDTTKRMSASKKKGFEPTSQQKRKHQITYLAYQAKANEAELQNQWANNKMSKRQTQSKYGF